MGACMDFPEDIKDFINSYSFKDNKEVYTNGSDLIEVYRVEQALEHYMPRWIPTEERLPEQDGEYLVCLRGGWRMVDSYTAVKNDKGIWHSWSYADTDIVAWMPLPEPYRGGCKNEK